MEEFVDSSDLDGSRAEGDEDPEFNNAKEVNHSSEESQVSPPARKGRTLLAAGPSDRRRPVDPPPILPVHRQNATVPKGHARSDDMLPRSGHHETSWPPYPFNVPAHPAYFPQHMHGAYNYPYFAGGMHHAHQPGSEAAGAAYQFPGIPPYGYHQGVYYPPAPTAHLPPTIGHPPELPRVEQVATSLPNAVRNARRRASRAENNAIAEEVLASTDGGRPVFKIITNEDGNIVRRLTKWQQIVKFHVDRYLDFGCRQFKRQHPPIVQMVHVEVAKECRYEPYPLKERALDQYIRNYMTTARSDLKTYFKQHGRDPAKKPSECPQRVWDPLVKWWLSPEGLKEEADRQFARANVRHTPHVGRAGALGAALKLAAEKEEGSPTGSLQVARQNALGRGKNVLGTPKRTPSKGENSGTAGGIDSVTRWKSFIEARLTALEDSIATLYNGVDATTAGLADIKSMLVVLIGNKSPSEAPCPQNTSGGPTFEPQTTEINRNLTLEFQTSGRATTSTIAETIEPLNKRMKIGIEDMPPSLPLCNEETGTVAEDLLRFSEKEAAVVAAKTPSSEVQG